MAVLAPVLSKPVGQPVKVRRTGAMLAPGRRTVAAVRRVLGRRLTPHWHTSQRVLTRAVWSPLTASRLLRRR